VAQEFYNSLEVDAPLKDVRFTGSLANFNYTKHSDIDLHLIIDFSKVGENTALVKNYFDAKRSLWNNKHKILIKGYEIEVYVENYGETHISTGVFSLPNNRWIYEPSKHEGRIDRAGALKKADSVASEIIGALRSQDPLETLKRIKDKIRKMRSCGLEKAGVFSIENLAFKLLRNGGSLDKLSSAITKEYDKQHSLPEEQQRT